jgi:hypothetical protein
MQGGPVKVVLRGPWPKMAAHRDVALNPGRLQPSLHCECGEQCISMPMSQRDTYVQLSHHLLSGALPH